MDTKTVNIISDGEILANFTKDQVIENLMRLFNKERIAIEQLLSMKGAVIKKELDATQVDTYVKTLTQAGIVVRIENSAVKPIETTTSYSAYATPKTELPSSEMNANTDYAEVPVFSIHGRLGRLRFFAWTTLPASAVMLLMYLFIDNKMVMFLAHIPIMAFLTTLYIRRAHDLDWSGWLGAAIYLVPVISSYLEIRALDMILGLPTFIFMILFLFKKGTEYENKYGKISEPNTPVVTVLSILGVVVFIGTMIVFMSAVTSNPELMKKFM